jgi:hypothetical protein
LNVKLHRARDNTWLCGAAGDILNILNIQYLQGYLIPGCYVTYTNLIRLSGRTAAFGSITAFQEILEAIFQETT